MTTPLRRRTPIAERPLHRAVRTFFAFFFSFALRRGGAPGVPGVALAGFFEGCARRGVLLKGGGDDASSATAAGAPLDCPSSGAAWTSCDGAASCSAEKVTTPSSGSVARQTTPRVERRDGGVRTTADVQASRQSREAALARRAVGGCAACGRWRGCVAVAAAAAARADMPPGALSPQTRSIARAVGGAVVGWCGVVWAPPRWILCSDSAGAVPRQPILG